MHKHLQPDGGAQDDSTNVPQLDHRPREPDLIQRVDNVCTLAPDVCSARELEYLKIYDAVQASGQPNFKGCRLPLPTNLNMAAWRADLLDYPDRELRDVLEFGWPIGYTLSTWPTTYNDNHASASAYPEHVDVYLHTECQYGVVLGPFDQPPFQWSHSSPLMTRDKHFSPHRQVIVDLSFPPGHSVKHGIPNDDYLGVSYRLRYPTVDDFAQLIVSKGPGALMYKLDISRAYRNLHSDPSDWPLMCLQWPVKTWYVYTAIAFGLRTGSMACQRTTNVLVYIMQRQAFDLVNYIDDLAGCEVGEKVNEAFSYLRTLLLKGTGTARGSSQKSVASYQDSVPWNIV